MKMFLVGYKTHSYVMIEGMDNEEVVFNACFSHLYRLLLVKNNKGFNIIINNNLENNKPFCYCYLKTTKKKAYALNSNF